MSSQDKDLLTIGWREWIGLPDIGIDRIKVKVDTGARTSALHAFEVRPFTHDGVSRVEFKMHPLQHDRCTVVVCTADVVDERIVTDSGGHKELRRVITTNVLIGGHTWPIEATLTSRDDMMFRMLLGRTAISGRAQVDPSRSYVLGKARRRNAKG